MQGQLGFSPIVTYLVIYGTGTTGLFQYSGTPGPGNPPIAWSVPPGVTTDPFGNALPLPGTSVSLTQGGFTTRSGTQLSQIVGGQILLGPSTGFSPSGLNASATGGILQVACGEQTSSDTPTAIDLFSGQASGTTRPLITVNATSPPAQMLLNASSPATAAQLEIQGTTALKNSAAPASVAGYAEPFAIGGNLAFVSADGNTYDTGKQRVVSFTGGTQTISAITFANVTGAVFNVGIGHYSIHVKVWLTTSAAAGAPQFQLTTPAASASSFMASFTQTPGPVAPIGRANSSGFTPGIGLTLAGAGTGQIFDAEFDATFTAAGAVNLQALTTIAGDNFIVNTVYIDLAPVN